MGFETYSDEKLLASKKRVKAILWVLILIWSILITAYLVFVIFFQKSENFAPITIMPFLVGPLTLLPIVQQNTKLNKETRRRKLLQ